MSAPPIGIASTDWQLLVELLKRHVPEYEIWAFGSRVRRAAKRFSDIDLAILTDRPLPLGVRADLADDLAESELPFKVDLVDWATTSDCFREIIRRDHVIVQRPPQCA